MCGIYGQLRFDQQAVEQVTLDKMLAKVARRGPDGNGQYVKGPLGLGHCRLAIIDLSTNGAQPMIDKALGLTLVFNGTIYNYLELRSKLTQKGYQFFSHSDTEVIIKAYHHWGEQCVEFLDGMFAFALYQHNSKQLFLARDRMGIKPLYYHQDGKALSFASTLQALLTLPQVDSSINASGLHYQLSLHGVIPAPQTIIKSINKVKPATTMLIDAKGHIKTHTYWQPTAQRITGFSEGEYIERAHELLKKAVKKRVLACDVPIGVLLSGGLDSSLIVGLLAEIGQEDIRTFSIGFEDVDDEVGSEFFYSDLMADKFKTHHIKYTIDNKEVLSRLPEAVTNMAEPMVGQDAVAFYLLSEQVAKHIKVVLSGQGADESFGGYFWYAQMMVERGGEVDNFSKHYVDAPHHEFLQTVNSRYHGDNHTELWLQKQFKKKGATTFLDKVLRLDITRLIVDDPVKRVDNMTMAWGLEARVPFMDTELVEWALSIPPEIKLKADGKYPLKYIAKNLLPKQIIERQKGYFPMPALKYVQGDFLNFMREILTAKACTERGLFNQAYIKQLLAQPKAYMTALNGSRLWHLALLELWLQSNVGNR